MSAYRRQRESVRNTRPGHSVWSRIARVGLLSSIRVAMRPWVLGPLLLMAIAAWSGNGPVRVTTPNNELKALQPTVADTLQIAGATDWGLLYALAVPCALFGVALSCESRAARWPSIVTPRTGGIGPYVASNIGAGLILTVTTVTVYAVGSVTAGLLRGARWAGPDRSPVAQLAMDSAGERPYTIVPQLGFYGSMALAWIAVTAVTVTAMLIGLWLGTLSRRVPIAAILAVLLLVMSARIVNRTFLGNETAARVDLWSRNNLDYYVGRGAGGVGGVSIVWAVAVPVLLSLLLIFLTWRTTRRRGVTAES